jgi:anti-anti-sigma factor
MTTAHNARGHSEVRTEVDLSILHRPTHTIVRLRGDIDIATAPALRKRLLGVLRRGMRLLILDLSGVSFCDAAGLAVLIGTRHRATLLGITLRLTAPHPRVAKVLRITGLDRSITIFTTLADTLARGGARGRRPHPRIPAGHQK